MVNRKIFRLLLGSTVVSSLFSLAVIGLTIFHHLNMSRMLGEIKKQKSKVCQCSMNKQKQKNDPPEALS